MGVSMGTSGGYPHEAAEVIWPQRTEADGEGRTRRFTTKPQRGRPDTPSPLEKNR